MRQSIPSAVTIGNFDGVHLGHAALVHAGRQAAGPDGRVIALTFEPHPMTVLRPNALPRRLTRFEQRHAYLLEAGANEVIAIEPTTARLNQSPADFIAEVVGRFSPTHIVEGPDFRFGRARSGTVSTLRQLERTNRYHTIVVDPVEVHLTDHSIVQVSSSMARWLIEQGRIDDAARLLGRPYELWATVVRGDRRGRTIGFPTANLAHEPCLLPADGIYAGVAILPDGAEHTAAISVGTKPTFGGGTPRTCEAYMLDYEGPVDDYGWEIRLSFHHWLRDQLVFSGIDPLVAQLRRDVEETRAMLMVGV